MREASTGATPDGDATTAPPVLGAAQWARAFRVDLDPVPAPARAATEEHGTWRVYAPTDHPLVVPLRQVLERGHVGNGVLVCLPEECAEEDLRLALAGARAAVSGSGDERFVLVQHGRRGAAGIAKTLRLEAPHVRTTIVHIAPGPDTVNRVLTEVAGTVDCTEVYYGTDGTRRVPTLRSLPIEVAQPHPALDGTDVLLVTGGGKGVTAECALAMASDTGASLALIGPSDPATDAELATNLSRIRTAGVTVGYARADVTNPAQVQAAVVTLAGQLGPVTAVLHGYGNHEPAPLTGVDTATVRAAMASAVDGLRNVLDAVDTGRLHLVVALASISGRTGLPGEAHHAVANEWLADLFEKFAEEHPTCRTLCLEWSVWSGTGEALSVVEPLSRRGVTPITPEHGLAVLRRLLADPGVPRVVVVSSRTGDIDTVARDEPELPSLRFVDRPLVRYHGVELVTEVDLDAGSDPYLTEHRLGGILLFPAVLGMEAMAQVATALTGWQEPPLIEKAKFIRPIAVAPNGSTTVRIAAVRTGESTVYAAVQSADTGFAAEHFRAELRRADAVPGAGPPEQVADGLPPVRLDPATELYGDIAFQGRRFQRLRRYHRAAARHVDATVEALPETAWFAPALPQQLILGDPGLRDALMHGTQVCVPDGTLLPIQVDAVHTTPGCLARPGQLRYCATERGRDGDTYVYDIVLRDADGTVVERWSGLHLRAIRKRDRRGPWVASLLGSYLERTVGDLTGGAAEVVVEPDGQADGSLDHLAARRANTARAAGRLLGRPVEVCYRPEVGDTRKIAAAHGAGLTLCVTAIGVVACDVRPVRARDARAWRDLLGRHHQTAGLLASATGESLDTAATRVWTAVECLRQAGGSAHAPLTPRPVERAGWTILSSGPLRIGVLATSVRGHDVPVVFAVLVEGNR